MSETENALIVEQAKNQSARQMVDEIVGANIQLRAGTILLQRQIKELNDKYNKKIPVDELNNAALNELLVENKKLKDDNKKLQDLLDAMNETSVLED